MTAQARVRAQVVVRTQPRTQREARMLWWQRPEWTFRLVVPRGDAQRLLLEPALSQFCALQRNHRPAAQTWYS